MDNRGWNEKDQGKRVVAGFGAGGYPFSLSGGLLLRAILTVSLYFSMVNAILCVDDTKSGQPAVNSGRRG